MLTLESGDGVVCCMLLLGARTQQDWVEYYACYTCGWRCWVFQDLKYSWYICQHACIVGFLSL